MSSASYWKREYVKAAELVKEMYHRLDSEYPWEDFPDDYPEIIKARKFIVFHNRRRRMDEDI